MTWKDKVGLLSPRTCPRSGPNTSVTQWIQLSIFRRLSFIRAFSRWTLSVQFFFDVNPSLPRLRDVYKYVKLSSANRDQIAQEVTRLPLDRGDDLFDAISWSHERGGDDFPSKLSTTRPC